MNNISGPLQVIAGELVNVEFLNGKAPSTAPVGSLIDPTIRASADARPGVRFFCDNRSHCSLVACPLLGRRREVFVLGSFTLRDKFKPFHRVLVAFHRQVLEGIGPVRPISGHPDQVKNIFVNDDEILGSIEEDTVAVEVFSGSSELPLSSGA